MFLLFRIKLQEISIPSKKKPRKGYKHSGSYNQFPFSEKNFDELSKILGKPISDDAKWQLQDKGGEFALNHHAIDNAVKPSEIDAACDSIVKQGEPLAQTLKELDDTTLDKISMQQKTDILEIHERLQADLEIFLNATVSLIKRRKKIKAEFPVSKQGRRKERGALEILVKELIPIFEGITNKKATSTFNELYTEGLFVTFTRDCIHAIQNEFIGDHAIVKAIQKALQNN